MPKTMSLERQVKDLQRDNVALRKTVNALMERVEQTTCLEAQSFNVFEQNISLNERLAHQTAELQLSRERMRLAMFGASDGFWVWDMEADEIWFSDRFWMMLGYDASSRPATIGAFIDAVEPTRRDEFIERICGVRGDSRVFDFECRFITREGEHRWFRIRGLTEEDVRGRCVRSAGSIHDISERRAMEEQLRRERALLENVLSNIPYQVSWKDPTGAFVGCNEPFARSVGLNSTEEIAGLRDEDLPWSTQRAAVYGEGEQQVLDGGPVVLNEERAYTDHDGRRRIFLSNKTALRDEWGGIMGVLAIDADITKRKELESQLAQSQKLQSIGQLASGIAHEINTPTQFVGDNLHFLREQFEQLNKMLACYGRVMSPDAADMSWAERHATVQRVLDETDYEFVRSEIPPAIEEALEGVQRVASIVSAMKNFSHPGLCQQELTDLNRAIESTVTVCRNRWKYVAELELDLDPDLPRAPCLGAEFNQVILNVIVNAADAIAERFGESGRLEGRIVVSTRRVEDAAEIRIADNGGGVPEEIRDRIFDPFFTTKEVGRGTGQGLAISRSVIVDKHAGAIECEVTPGQGTVFIIRLPLRTGGASPRAA